MTKTWPSATLKNDDKTGKSFLKRTYSGNKEKSDMIHKKLNTAQELVEKEGLLFMTVDLAVIKCNALIDSGSTCSLISMRMVSESVLTTELYDKKGYIVSAGGPIETKQIIQLSLML